MRMVMLLIFVGSCNTLDEFGDKIRVHLWAWLNTRLLWGLCWSHWFGWLLVRLRFRSWFLINHVLLLFKVNNSVDFLHNILSISFFLNISSCQYLKPEEVTLIVHTKSQNVRVVLIDHGFEHCIPWEHDDIKFLHMCFQVSPLEVRLLLLSVLPFRQDVRGLCGLVLWFCLLSPFLYLSRIRIFLLLFWTTFEYYIYYVCYSYSYWSIVL